MNNEEKKPSQNEVDLKKDAKAPAEQPKASKEKADKPKKEKRGLNKKKLKYGSVATGITVVFIAVVVLLNVVVSALMDRYPIKADLTSDKLYEISQQSIDYMKTVTKDIEISVMYSENYFQTGSSYLKIIPETLDKYRQYAGGDVKVTYYDMTANPDAVKQFSNKYSGTIEEGDIVITCGDRIKVIGFDQIIATQTSMDPATYQQKTDYSFVGEQSITAAIMSVTDANPMTVGIINQVAGNDIYYQTSAYSVQMVQELLDKNGYDVKTIDIMSGELDPETYDLLVLPAPYNDLTEAMVKKLEDFLYNDGKYQRNLFYIADGYQSTSMPNLNAFLNIWGIEIGNSIVYEGDDSVAQYVQLALGTISHIPVAALTDNETYNQKLAASKLPVIAPLGRPIKLLWEANNDRTTASLLQSSATSFLRPFTSTESEDTAQPGANGSDSAQTTEAQTTTTTAFDQSKAETGVQNLMAVSTTTFYSGAESYASNLMVLSSSSMLDYYVAQNASYRNAEYIIGAVNTMVGKDNTTVIAPKALEQTTIVITEGQVNAIRTVTVIGIPAFVLLLGLVVYLRRRNR